MRQWVTLFALLLLVTACKVDLYTNLEEQEANEIVAALMKAGISADRVLTQDDTLTVTVEETQFADAVELLKRLGYPRESYASMGEVFSGDSLVSSPLEERARLVYALGQELSHTVAEIDGVISSRVHVVLPDDDPLRGRSKPSAASVFVKHHQERDVGQLVPQIKMLVANSIEGLIYDNVSVALFPVAPVEMETTALLNTTPTMTQGSQFADNWLFFVGGGLFLLCIAGGQAFFMWQTRRRENLGSGS